MLPEKCTKNCKKNKTCKKSFDESLACTELVRYAKLKKKTPLQARQNVTITKGKTLGYRREDFRRISSSHKAT